MRLWCGSPRPAREQYCLALAPQHLHRLKRQHWHRFQHDCQIKAKATAFQRSEYPFGSFAQTWFSFLPLTCQSPVNPGSALNRCFAGARSCRLRSVDRARAHNAHFAPQYVDKLWQFIQPRGSQNRLPAE